MIAFGVCIRDEDRFQSVVLPGIRVAMEPDSPIGESTESKSLAAAYNEMLDAFGTNPELEALVFVNDEAEIRDPNLMSRIRSLLDGQGVAIVGVAGARSVSSLAWWNGERFGRYSDATINADFGGGTHDVEIVDGLLMVLSGWAVRNLRFDTAYEGFHGAEADLCLQARRANKRVVVTDIDVDRHSKGSYGDVGAFRTADYVFRTKWASVLTQTSPAITRTAPATELKYRALVEVGGGTNAIADWINLDPVHGEGPWKRGAQDAPWPLDDGVADMVWASHVMEHVAAGNDRISVMNEAWRVLRPGGTFEIRVPGFPNWAAIADPTHVSFWVGESFLYFTGQLGANADYGISFWELDSLALDDGWELRCVLRKPFHIVQA